MSDLIHTIALYLPQFHPIPENDEWWGKGFTEWTNVTKAKPLFKGHFQPRLPADLGFYDLRVAEAREAQAELAKQYGVSGFCYWHYWFSGRRIIERPLNEVVQSGKPDLPFCIAWANQTWSGTWHGLSNNKILIEQNYPGVKDHEKHFYEMVQVFSDKRYMEVNGKKLVFVFRPMDIPNPLQFTNIWQELAVKEGLKGFHFIGMHMTGEWDPCRYGFNAFVEAGPMLYKIKDPNMLDKALHRFFKVDLDKVKQIRLGIPKIASYKKYVDRYPDHKTASNEYPMIYPGWDNTPRSGANGWLFEGSTPELFYQLCLKGLKETLNKPKGERILILKSWNEWAEGNYLEPDKKYGHRFLEAYNTALKNFKKDFYNHGKMHS